MNRNSWFDVGTSLSNQIMNDSYPHAYIRQPKDTYVLSRVDYRIHLTTFAKNEAYIKTKNMN